MSALESKSRDTGLLGPEGGGSPWATEGAPADGVPAGSRGGGGAEPPKGAPEASPGPMEAPSAGAPSASPMPGLLAPPPQVSPPPSPAGSPAGGAPPGRRPGAPVMMAFPPASADATSLARTPEAIELAGRARALLRRRRADPALSAEIWACDLAVFAGLFGRVDALDRGALPAGAQPEAHRIVLARAGPLQRLRDCAAAPLPAGRRVARGAENRAWLALDELEQLEDTLDILLGPAGRGGRRRHHRRPRHDPGS